MNGFGSYVPLEDDYYQSHVRASVDERSAPVPGWGLWTNRLPPRIGVGQDVPLPSDQGPVMQVLSSPGAPWLILGGFVLGGIAGYLVARG